MRAPELLLETNLWDILVVPTDVILVVLLGDVAQVLTVLFTKYVQDQAK